jgi:DNA-binding CsgD family transcriptional regulator
LWGGTVPADDILELKRRGVAEVFAPGAPTDQIVDFVKQAARSTGSHQMAAKAATSTKVKPTKDRVADTAKLLLKLPSLHQRLRSSTSVADLFARAAEIGRNECGFARCIVISVAGSQLSAGESDSLADPASDSLRRQLLAEPLAIQPGTEEFVLIRRAEGSRAGKATRQSALAEKLELDDYALGIVAPEGRVLALILLDRPGPEVDPLDQAVVNGLGAMLSMALEHLVLRARVAELAAELRHMNASSQALTTELLEAPVSLPSERRHGPTFPWTGVIEPLGRAELHELLSERERQIATLLVEGRSNRQIATELMLSAETVKDHVARILRKLGSANRVEAVARLVALTQPPIS